MKRLGVLLSGGKDSVFSAFLASSCANIVCGITISSKNTESCMFHTPSINMVGVQAELMNIPLIIQETQGEKELELEDLRTALLRAKEEHSIEGIVTGAVASQYQASRIERLCHELDLLCYNPLWQVNQMELLENLLRCEFKVLIVGIFAYPFTKDLLGRCLDVDLLNDLEDLENKFKINPAGEGGELETFVLDCPLFSKEIIVCDKTIEMSGEHSGVYSIKNVDFVNKVKKTANNSKLLRAHQGGAGPLVTIVSCCSLGDELLEQEFVRPLVDVVVSSGFSYEIIHISKLGFGFSGEKIIFSGTALWDDEYEQYKDRAKIVFEKKLPSFGICAGAQIIGSYFGKEIQEVYKLGPHLVKEIKPHPLSEGFDNSSQYFLHKKGFLSNSVSVLTPLLICDDSLAFFKVKDFPFFGTTFHSELNDKIILKRFLKEDF